MGCGEGADAHWLAGRGRQVTAVDVAPTAVQRAARVIRSDHGALPCPRTMRPHGPGNSRAHGHSRPRPP
ncbi:methyltransferase domain-containing protein [Streptomyces sp. NPDC006012]|uniref:methyltransferase domain-containing protein n=1 Tax=Streptomyces sp. NPDC006012 TaxID=3364739 RepID=UPI0036CE724A